MLLIEIGLDVANFVGHPLVGDRRGNATDVNAFSWKKVTYVQRKASAEQVWWASEEQSQEGERWVEVVGLL